ncbi:hypothetical protein V6N11_074104 [Hibiscus sabdariffa]|uniref:Uncharacterized protein n=1 Tax=Hibiscus sabdariffa TaxID=183260 RepID=A0ABR1ZYH1_9ROSI
MGENMENEKESEDNSNTHMEGFEGDCQIGKQLNVKNQLEQEQAGMKNSFRDTLIEDQEAEQVYEQKSDTTIGQMLDPGNVHGPDVQKSGTKSPVETIVEKPDDSSMGRVQRRLEQDTVEKSRGNGEVRMELDENAGLVGDEGVHNMVTVLGREVASADGIVVSETSLNKEKHVVMRVGDELNVQTHTPRLGRVLPALIRGNIHKPLTIMSELDSTKESASTSNNNLQRHNASVQWQENVVFDHPNGDRTQGWLGMAVWLQQNLRLRMPAERIPSGYTSRPGAARNRDG